MQEAMNKVTVPVASYYCKYGKQAGFKVIISAIESCSTDTQIMNIISGEVGNKKFVPVTNRKQWDSMSKDEKYNRVIQLETENFKLKDI